MNEIFDLLRQYTVEEISSIPATNWTHITSNIQNADHSSIVFYKLGNNEKDEELFYQRWQEKEIGLLVTNRSPVKYKGSIALISEKNFLKLQSKLADVLYPLPTTIKIIGVTGTNGKTSVVDFISQLGRIKGLVTASIGTLGFRKDGKLLEDFGLTSPSYIDLRRMLHTLNDVHLLAIEVSSHALFQNRMYDIKIDLGVWTNLTQDHLDYHKTMDKYFQAKLKIFELGKREDFAVLVPRENGDLKHRLSGVPKVRFVSPIKEEDLKDGPLFFLVDYNRSNLALAMEAINTLFQTHFTPGELMGLTPPPGRFELIELEGKFVIIDYAHTPDALENVLSSVKKIWADKKLAVVFGCGGDRDRTKRPQMGEIVQK